MKKIAIFTTTRAEFGIFSSLIKQFEKEEDIDYLLFVGGAHLAPEHGKTISEIKSFQFRISDKFDFLLNEDKNSSLAKSLGIATYELAHIFQNFDFDLACILGDRFELLSIVTNAILFRIPIVHLHGGEKTEGVIDEQLRHMYTKAAHIHFVTAEEYAENVRKMGESENRIFNVGALSIDNIVNNPRISKTELFGMLDLDESRCVVLMTYHPVTLEFSISPIQQMKYIFEALKQFDFQVVITAPNIETHRDKIISYIEQEIFQNPDYHYIESLGVVKYHSLIPHCQFVIGNSSSGIVEVPFFRIPTINIGDRQQGRIRHRSVIDTSYEIESIIKGIEKAISAEFREGLKNMKCKFGDGTAAKKMVEIIKTINIDQELIRKQLDFPGDE
jgi:UDP-hydrolysing UDP-N-acetyl-D-glucosamine 2-epimerase